MSMVGYVAMSSVVRMVAAAQTIPHAVMSSGCADGITIPSCMRLAGNHDRLSFLIPVIKIDCVCSMSMVGYVAMSSVVRMVAAAQTIPRAVKWSCLHVVRDGIITDYNTVMYAVLFARVRLLPVCPSAGWLSKLQVSYRQICK